MDFSEKLQALRKQMGLSQENLADRVGVSRQAVSKWETGQALPDVDKLVALSDLFGLSLDSLVRDTRDSTGNSCTQGGASVCRPFLWHYEYKSKRALFGVPLVHVNLGHGLHVAKGIVAVGNISVGCLSVGAIALGGISIGALALGLAGLGGLALGLLAAGGAAAGLVAAGGAAFGIVAMGGLAVGTYAFGGCAVASDIAAGGYASGHIAIGDAVRGAKTIVIKNHDFGSVGATQVRALINEEYPRLWKPLAGWILSLFR